MITTKNNPNEKVDKVPSKRLTPPYLSVSSLDKLIKLVSGRSLNSVSVEFFRTNSFNPSDAMLAVGALRFLGLINDANQTTDLVPKLRLTGDAGKQEMEKIIRAAYRKLFDATETPQDFSTEELKNAMVIQYDLSPRVARTAVPAFIKLCEYAGLKEPGSVVGRIRKPSMAKTSINRGNVHTKEKETPNPRESSARTGPFDYDFHIPIIDEKMYIEIPNEVYKKSLVDDDLNDDLRVLIKEAHKFAKKHISNDEPSGQKISEGG